MDTDRKHSEAEDTDELLCTDLLDSGRAMDMNPLRTDLSDRLLDAMDTQLIQLQVQSRKDISKKRDCENAVPLQRTQPLGKDTDLESTTLMTNGTPLSRLDLIHTPVKAATLGFQDDCVPPEESHRRTRAKEDAESRREEVIWRLQRLLGDTCQDDVIPEPRPPSDSICTEDFAGRFRDEMVDAALGDSRIQQPEKEDGTKGAEISGGDSGSKDAVASHYSQSKTTSRQKELDNCLSDAVRVNVSHMSERKAKRLGQEERVREDETPEHSRKCPLKTRCLAGVPLMSFDTVSIASDLDSVGTERVRQHIHSRPGWRSLIQSVSGINDNQSDTDTHTPEESEPQSAAAHSACFGIEQKTSPIVHKALHKKKLTHRRVSSSGDDDKDTDEEINLCKSEKMQQTKMKEQLSKLRQKCEKEEETLRLKKSQLQDVDFCLSELRQRRKHALQELERLTVEIAQMETEKQSMESVVSDRRTERESISCQVEELQRQKESFLNQIRDLEEEVATKNTLNAGFYKQKNTIMMSVLEREELERQLDAAKDALFAEQRRTRGKLEAMEELRDEEGQKLRKSLEQQREEAKKREEVLRKEASTRVNSVVEEERRKWEAEKEAAIQVHCGILEEQNKKSLESMRSEMQREKRKAQALQHKVLELKTKIQERERDSCVQQREQESLLTVICKSLKEEHQVELQRLRKQTAQDSQRTALQLEQTLRLAEREADRLRVTLDDRESCYNKMQAEVEQQHRHWAQELGAECQHLHLLLEQNGAKQSSVQPSTSPAVSEGLRSLRALREQVELLFKRLQQGLESQKQMTELLRNNTERETSVQMQQLRMEYNQALEFLKEQLIQEHIEEMSRMKRADVGDGGGVAASLRKQLKAKDLELRQVQMSMGQWKERTTARLACKFEEELTAELERCKAALMRGSKTMEQKPEKPEALKEEMMLHAKSGVVSPSLHVADLAASHSPSDVASFKLLRYLQTRVKQLRLENQSYNWSSSPPRTGPTDLSGSYLTTINGGRDIQS